MRKVIKSLLITSLSMIMIGMIGTIIFLSVGGLRQLTGEIAGGFMKIRDQVVDLWRTIPGVERLGSIEGIDINFDGSVVDVQINDAYEIHEGDYVDTQVASADEVTAIDISAMGLAMEIQPSDTSFYQLKSEDAERFQYYMEDGKLSVHALPKMGNRKSDTTSKMILYIPADASPDALSCILGSGTLDILIPLDMPNIDFNIGAGELKIAEAIKAEELIFRVGAGNVTVPGVTADTLKMDLGAGTFTVTDAEVAKAEFHIGMGTANYTGNISKSFQLDCGMGTAILKLNGTQTDYNYKIAGAAGTVQIDQDSFSGLAMERTIDNGASLEIGINCAMGNVTVNF